MVAFPIPLDDMSPVHIAMVADQTERGKARCVKALQTKWAEETTPPTYKTGQLTYHSSATDDPQGYPLTVQEMQALLPDEGIKTPFITKDRVITTALAITALSLITAGATMNLRSGNGILGNLKLPSIKIPTLGSADTTPPTPPASKTR